LLLLHRLEQVYFVQGSMHKPEALLRANAVAAAGAVLLLPWGASDASRLPCDTADAAGLVDAHIMAAARHLRSFNPHMQVGH
jgi:capsule polysaccharide export protein KpsC/LpsZ